eukprot:5991821-Pleurochrysis_carterae.AAC.2
MPALYLALARYFGCSVGACSWSRCAHTHHAFFSRQRASRISFKGASWPCCVEKLSHFAVSRAVSAFTSSCLYSAFPSPPISPKTPIQFHSKPSLTADTSASTAVFLALLSTVFTGGRRLPPLPRQPSRLRLRLRPLSLARTLATDRRAARARNEHNRTT